MRKILFIGILLAHSCKPVTHDTQLIATNNYTNINGSEIYYRMIGSGDPIIIIHGGPVLDHSYLLPQMDKLAENHQLIYYDQRACGRSSVEVDTMSMNLEGFVEDIELLRMALNLEDVTILGHSWGGFLAMNYAIMYPEHLKSLILSNSMPASTDDWQAENQELSSRTSGEDVQLRSEIIQSEAMKNDPSSAIKKIMLLSFKPQFKNIELLDSLRLFIPTDYMNRSKMFSYLGPDLASYDLYNGLTSLKSPTLIIYGDYEPAVHLSGQKLADAISNSTLSIIENAGHFPYIEQPKQYFKAIETFLSTSSKE
jgi:proline iminopeptidase